MKHLFKTIIYDFDGTIGDPADSITGTLNYVLDQLNRKTYPEEMLTKYIGPPLYDIFVDLLKTNNEAEVQHAVDLYRRKYNTENHRKCTLYSGIELVLKQATQNGITQFIATSKKQETIDLVCEHLGISHYFEAIFGLGTFPNKTEIITNIIDTFKLEKATCCMVGDRNIDIEAARKNNIFSVGVLWGYGSNAELEAASADQLVEFTDDLSLLFLQ